MLYQLQLWDRAYVQLKAAVSDEDTRERNGETTSHNNDSELKGGGVVIKIELACIHFIFDSHRWLHRWTCLPQAELNCRVGIFIIRRPFGSPMSKCPDFSTQLLLQLRSNRRHMSMWATELINQVYSRLSPCFDEYFKVK